MNDELLTLAAELAEVMRLAEDDDIAAILQRFVTRAARVIPGCAQAAIIARAQGSVEMLASSLPSDPEVLQPSPILEALMFREPRRLDDTGTDQRWPAFSAQLSAHGYRCCLAIPLATRSDPAAVLVLYSAEPERFSDCFGELRPDRVDLENQLRAFRDGKTKYAYQSIDLLGKRHFTDTVREIAAKRDALILSEREKEAAAKAAEAEAAERAQLPAAE